MKVPREQSGPVALAIADSWQSVQQFVQVGPRFPLIQLCRLYETVDAAGGLGASLVAVKQPVLASQDEGADGILGALS